MQTAQHSPSAPALRAIADQLIAPTRSPLIPADMYALPEPARVKLHVAVYSIAAEVEADASTVEMEFSDDSPFTVAESRDIFYLVCSAEFVS